ncbi:MAG: hypothetical protein JSV24_10350 [Bacteroidales bacterium]|nr:MAG: hypothetical protein JSV24_10350 [Bacteroidales bacterium]
MKPTVLKTTIRFLLFVIPVAGCTSYDTGLPEYRIVEVDNASAVFNMSTTYIYFGSLSREDLNPSVVVADGDLLLISMNDESLFFRYRESDGNLLEFSVDTSNNQRYFLGGKFVSIALTEDTVNWEWLSSCDENLLMDLRSLHLEFPIPGKYMPALQRIAQNNPGTGFVLESIGEESYPFSFIRDFKPEWLYITDMDPGKMSDELIASLENIELFGVEAENLEFIPRENQLPKLKNLIIKGWDPVASGNYALPEVKSLQSLTLVESSVLNLDFIEQFPELTNLHIIACDTLSDISGLEKLDRLYGLGLPFCNSIEDLSGIGQFKDLRWFTPPPFIEQEDLLTIVSDHIFLEFISFIDCRNIQDLSPISRLSMLKGIVLDAPVSDLSSLVELNDLELVIIKEEQYDDLEEAIIPFQQKRPDVKIIPGGGLCLGSGWILLVVPFVLMVVLVFRRKNPDNQNAI